MEFDLETFKTAIQIAGNGGTAAKNLSGGISGLLGLFRSSGVDETPEITLAMSELMMQVANLQATNADLTMTLIQMEAALRDAIAKQNDLDRYELWNAPAGAMVYRIKKGEESGQPSHLLCPRCFQKSQKSFLQGEETMRCHTCGDDYFVHIVDYSGGATSYAGFDPLE